ncbi:MAG: flagellar basal body P-ring formation chaperone FlgA, partial [Tabrizicola sp.]
KPVRLGDLGPPTLVERNQPVTLVYLSGGLAISTEGRALARGSVGDEVRVMNLGSRNTVTGRVGPDGTVYVGWNE